MKKIVNYTLSTFAFVSALAIAINTGAQVPNESALAGFGGAAGLEKITVDFVERIQKNPQIGQFFKDGDNERLTAKLNEQFCDLLGGGCKYSGRSMQSVHRGMGVKTADFNALAEELQNAMTAAGVSQSEQYRLIAKLAPMHRDVVEK
jgi:hemoglobin